MDIEKIIKIAKRRGFIFPGSEIYGGLAGFYDFGPLGTLMKRKIEESWREFFIKSDESIYEIETSMVMPEQVWKASGHLDSFVDPMVQCKKCNATFRADDLITEVTGKSVEGLKADELTKIIREENIKCPKCGNGLGDVRIFNLMLKTGIGPVEGNISYLRPETAQGIFVNFKNILNSTRAKLPFGVAQIGTSYRNEISPRQFLIRLREFRQMEIEFFVNPDRLDDCPGFDDIEDIKIKLFTREEQEKNGNPIEITIGEAVKQKILPNKYIAYFIAKEFMWYQKLGIPAKSIRFRHMLPKETPHYSSGNFDMEMELDFGWKEVVGNALRTDHDLKTHMEHSGEDMSFIEDGKKIVPYVLEPSFGIDRAIYGILLHTFVEDKERGWDWFKFPPKIAPVSVTVYPLVSKDNLPEKANEVYEMLKKDFDVIYDESGSIGKRYARSDEVGTPFALTIDYQTMKDNTVTIRDRDSTQQKRISLEDLPRIIKQLINGEIKLF